MLANWKGLAFNQVPDSANEIHGDKIAKDLGFTGGLVPGVTVSAYLTHPAIEAWGIDWLDRGSAHVKVNSPLYDEEQFDVEVFNQSDTNYEARLIRPDGTVSATAEVGLAESGEDAPTRRGDRVSNRDTSSIIAIPANMQKLKDGGCFAARFRWDGEHAMSTYLLDRAAMPDILRIDGSGYANMSMILGCSNWVLSRNAYMNPWLHLETQSQNYARIPLGTEILAEMEVRDLFTKKGHEFVDARVILFDLSDDKCLCSIDLRAIYKLRGL